MDCKIEDITPLYNFDLSICVISTPISPAVYQNGTYTRALTMENKEAVIKLKSIDSVDEPSLEIEVLFEEKHDEEDIEKLNGLKIITEPTPYEVLVMCICFQMVSFPVAMRIVENFVKTLGRHSELNPKLYLFPKTLTYLLV